MTVTYLSMNNPRYYKEICLFSKYGDCKSKWDLKDLDRLFGEYISSYEDESSLMRATYIVRSDPLAFVLDDTKRIKCYTSILEGIGYYVTNYRQHVNLSKRTCNIVAYYGFIFEYGLFGINYCKKEAFKYYKLSAELGSPYGTFKLAQCLEKGVGCNKNTKKALDFYRCAAKLGSVQALHTYGTILLHSSQSATKDTARFYLKLGCRRTSVEYPYVWYDYGRYLEYKLGDDDNTSDLEYCFQTYLKGANMECPNCQYKIAAWYEFGYLSIPCDVSQAVVWYERAARNGHVEAQIKIAQILVDTNSNDVTVRSVIYEFALKAAIRENPIACKYMEIFYRKGFAVKKNTHVANWWYTIFQIVCKKYNVSKPDPSLFANLLNANTQVRNNNTEIAIIQKGETIKA